jgi:hypothetical protein
MDEKTLHEALRYGSTVEHDERMDLGKFGLGLTTAGTSQGRRVRVYTREDGGIPLVGTLDLDEMKVSNSFDYIFRQMNKTELEYFVKKVHGSPHGTVVRIDRLDKVRPRNKYTLKTQLIEYCGITFAKILSAGSLSITVEGEKVKPLDPLQWNESGTHKIVDRTFFFDENMEKVESAAESVGTVRVRAGVLAGAGHHKNKSGHMKKQGFYVIRNQRCISMGDDLDGLLNKRIDTTRFRGEIEFSGQMDALMGVEFRKDKIVMADELREVLSGLISTINIALRKLIAEKRAGKKQDAEREKADARIENEIAAKSALLNLVPNKPGEEELGRSPEEEDVRGPWTRRCDPHVFGTDGKCTNVLKGGPRNGKVCNYTTQAGKPKAKKKTRTIADCKFVYIETGPYSPFFGFDMVDSKFIIEINTQHPFYAFREHMSDEGYSWVQKFLYSMAVAEHGLLTDDEDVIELFYQMKIASSNTLRTLLD